MSNDFTPGQRWLSTTEMELGLGLVRASDARTVTVEFRAATQTRTYTRQAAPLGRVRLQAGDLAEDQQGQALTVTAVEQQDGLLVYRVRGPDGDQRRLPEADLSDRLRVNRPQDRLLAARIDRDSWFRLRLRAWRQLAEDARSAAHGLVGARVDLIPHQLHVAAEVCGRLTPRVLLADEVGLGKTIEAGLIIHKLVLTERARRVLVVVPGALQHQWLVEMLRRFNLSFALFDRARIDALVEQPGNPFHSEQRVLCSLETLTGSADVAQAALGGAWDLLVVDEAHHLRWSEAQSSPEYALVAALAARSAGLLLLSATPEQFGRAGHFARLRLLDPDRFAEFDRFLADEARYEPVARLAAAVLEGQPLDPAQRALLDDWLGQAQDWQQLGNAAIVDRLVDRHGTGRVMFRNTRAAVGGFARRRVLPVELSLPTGPSGPEIGRTAGSTTGLGHGNPGGNPKLRWLKATLHRLKPAKVLLIAEQAGTVVALRAALQAGEGIPAAVFHQDMSIIERDRAAAWFAATDGGAQVLLCSEIGSEGRNFQFAQHLVLYDLPPDPELLEQRIGRLDRIGQTGTIQLHIPYLPGSRDETLFRWYHEGLDAIAQHNPAAAAVQQTLADDLERVLAGEAALLPLLDRAADTSAALNAQLAAGRDRLLELHSHRPGPAAALVDAIRDQQHRGPSLPSYMGELWDAFGVDHEPGPDGSVVLHPTAHMIDAHFPGLPDDGTTVTFGRAAALSHEDWQFLTREHPMVRGAMEMLTGEERGAAALSLVRHPAIRPGSYLLELVYLVECSAPAELQVSRFLPPTPLRLLLDRHGHECSASFDDEGALIGECLARDTTLAGQILEALGEQLRPLFATADRLAEQAAEPVIGAALTAMREALDSEGQRLEALARSNPNVRPEEVEQLTEQRWALDQRLAASRVRLDAARLIVAH